MKKLLSVLLVLALALSMGVAAFAEDALDGEGATLTLALRAGTYAEVIKECLPAFENAYNVKTDVLELSEDDLHSKVALDAINSEGAYDLCMVDGSWMAEYTSSNILLNLTDGTS